MTMMRILHSFAKDQSGTAAIEFAFVLPALLTLCLGMFEFASFINADMKLANTAQLMADLVAQQTNETNSLTSNFCTGGQMSLAPLSTATLKVAIASVTHYSGGTSVDWQDTTCGGAATIANAVALATPVIPNVGDSVIVTQATYSYASPVTYVLASKYTLTQTSFSRPRNVANVTHS
jgi:Flp pilus assembly protein TadG